MKFRVPDMSCRHCTATVEKAIKAMDPGATVDTDLTSKTVVIESTKDAGEVQTTLKDAGYPATHV